MGAAELEGASTKAAAGRAAAASAGIARFEAALAEWERRDSARQAKEAEAEARRQRAHALAYLADWLAAGEGEALARDAAYAAKVTLEGFSVGLPKLLNLKEWGHEIDLDALGIKDERFRRVTWMLERPKMATAEQLHELRTVAEALAAEAKASAGETA